MKKTHESIADIEANGTLLLNLVNNILTISKAEANRNELLVEPVDFVDLLGFIKKTLDPIAANKDIALSAKADANVPISMADWEKLRRVIENLADNAIKYTHRGGWMFARRLWRRSTLARTMMGRSQGTKESLRMAMAAMSPCVLIPRRDWTLRVTIGKSPSPALLPRMALFASRSQTMEWVLTKAIFPIFSSCINKLFNRLTVVIVALVWALPL